MWSDYYDNADQYHHSLQVSFYLQSASSFSHRFQLAFLVHYLNWNTEFVCWHGPENFVLTLEQLCTIFPAGMKFFHYAFTNTKRLTKLTQQLQHLGLFAALIILDDGEFCCYLLILHPLNGFFAPLFYNCCVLHSQVMPVKNAVGQQTGGHWYEWTFRMAPLTQCMNHTGLYVFCFCDKIKSLTFHRCAMK